ncbi:hypothetical protein ABBQ38_011171 [Trebouxia sp. C0009 RCD-2024]
MPSTSHTASNSRQVGGIPILCHLCLRNDSICGVPLCVDQGRAPGRMPLHLQKALVLEAVSVVAAELLSASPAADMQTLEVWVSKRSWCCKRRRKLP